MLRFKSQSYSTWHLKTYKVAIIWKKRLWFELHVYLYFIGQIINAKY